MREIEELNKRLDMAYKAIEHLTDVAELQEQKLAQITAASRAVAERARATDAIAMSMMPLVMRLAVGRPDYDVFQKWYDSMMREQVDSTLKSMSTLMPHLKPEKQELFASLMQTDFIDDEGVEKILKKFGVTKEDLIAQGVLHKSEDCQKDVKIVEGMLEAYVVSSDSQATMGCDCGWCTAVRDLKGKHDEVNMPMGESNTKH